MVPADDGHRLSRTYVRSLVKCVGASETCYSDAPAIRAQVQMMSCSNVQTLMKHSKNIQQISRCRSTVADANGKKGMFSDILLSDVNIRTLISKV